MDFRRRWAGVTALEPVDLATRLTLLLFVFSGWVHGDQWRYSIPLRLLGALGLLVPPLHRHRALWALLFATMALKSVEHWTTQDNHLFLLTWWCLALALHGGAEEGRPALTAQARLLLGLSFAFATAWKALWSPDFISGSYFQFTFLTDPRFSDAAALFGGVSDAIFGANRQALAALADPHGEVDAVRLQSAPHLPVFAGLVTGWTLLIEAGLAVVVLVPRAGRARDVLLLTFASTTYLVASVTTFGWTLLSIGVVQAEAKRTRALYLTCSAIVLLYGQAPLLGWLRAATGTP